MATFKRLILALCIALGLAFTMAPAHTRSYGESSRDIMTTSFEQLSVSGPLSVEIKTGATPSIVAYGDRDSLDRLLVRKTGDRLRLSLRQTRTDIDPVKQRGGRLRIVLSTWELNSLDLSGTADVSADVLSGQDVTVSVAGAGHVSIDKLLSDLLEINMLGNGSLTIGNGESDQARVELNGAPSLEAPEFQAERLRLSLIGPGSVRMKVRDAAQISSSGAGFVEILGHPTCEYQGSGTSEIICDAR